MSIFPPSALPPNLTNNLLATEAQSHSTLKANLISSFLLLSVPVQILVLH